MIYIKYELSQNCMSLEIKGHADYERLGKDIVCASVSTIACGLSSYVQGQANPHTTRMSAGDVYIELASPDRAAREVFEFCVDTLKSIAEIYPQNILMG